MTDAGPIRRLWERAWGWLLVVDPALTGFRTAAFGLLGGTGGLLLGVTVGAFGSGNVAGVVLPTVVGAVGSTPLSGAAVPNAGRTGLVVGAAGGLAALLIGVLPPGVGGSAVVQIALLTLATVAAGWLRGSGPSISALGLAVWLGVAVTVAGGHRPSGDVVLTSTATLLTGGWLALLAVTLFRPRPGVGVQLSLAGLFAATDRRALAIDRPKHRTPARIRLLRLALMADAQLQRDPTAPGAQLRVAVIGLHAAADAAVAGGSDGEAVDRGRARIAELRRAVVHPGTTADRRDLVVGATIAQGVLPGSRPAEQATRPDGWGTNRALPSAGTRAAVRVSVAALLAGAIGTLLLPGHFVWAVLTVFTALSGPAATSTAVTRSLGRVAGTAVGVAVGLVVDHLIGGIPGLLAVVAAVGIALGFWIQARHYTWAMSAGTVAIAGLYRFLNSDPTSMLTMRLAETAIGGLSACLVTLVFWPVSSPAVRRTVDEDLSRRRRELSALLAEVSPQADPDLVRDEVAAAVVRQAQAVDAWLSAEPSGASTDAVLDDLARSRRCLDRVA